MPSSLTSSLVKIALDLALISPVPLDQLPYSSDFERLYKLCVTAKPGTTRQEFWRALLYVRKKGLMKKKGQPRTAKSTV